MVVSPRSTIGAFTGLHLVRPERSLSVLIASGLACVTLVLSLAHLVALATGGEVRIADWRIAAIAAGYDRKANDLLATTKPTAADLVTSERLSYLALREFPYDTSSWLRIAYIDQRRHAGLSPIGISALSRSYDLIAADPASGPWRVRFALENWPSLPKSIRKSVRHEAQALSREARSRAKLRTELAAVRNSEAAVLVTLWRQRYAAQ